MYNVKEDNNGLEKLMGKLGDWGRYQRFQFFLQVMAALPTGMAMISLVTIAAVPEHRCKIEGVDTSDYIEPWNSSIVTEHIPQNKDGTLDSCHIYGFNKTVEECNSWVYSPKYFTSSRGIEWDFVCHRRWKVAATQSIFMIGTVIGSAVIGPLCDTFGRRTVFLWTGVFQLTCGILCAFTYQYFMFIIVRFLYGLFAISPFKAGYVLMIELVGPSKRAMCGAIFQTTFSVGIMLLGIWGYFIDNRFYLQIIYALHAVVMLPQWFMLDESPRWLWAKGRLGEAIAVVEKGLKINKSNESLDTPLITSHYRELSDPDENRSGTILDLFRTPNMTKRSIIIFGCWFAASVVYYGLALNTGKLDGNPFFILFLSVLVEIPGYAMGMYFVNIIGHRLILSLTFLTSGTTCLVLVALPSTSIITTVLSMFGKLIASASFAIMYKYSAELFPTVVRSTGIGFSTMCASLSASVTPLITLLDAFRPEIPTVFFGISALVFGLCCLLLPETKGRRLPQTLKDGEHFGEGESCFLDCRRKRIESTSSDSLEAEPLKITVFEKKKTSVFI